MVFDTAIWQVVLAAVVYFAIGAVWYSPVLFATPWMKALGKKKSEIEMAAPAMLTTFVAISVLVVFEAYLKNATATAGFVNGAALGAILALGFVATTALVNSSFQGRNRNLYLIDQGYHLVGIILAGSILAI